MATKKRGPKPKDSPFKVVSGARSRGKSASIPGVPSCPFPLTGEAMKEWRRFAPILHDKGLLTSAYAPAFALYCMAYGINSDSRAELEGAIVLTTDSGGSKGNPAAALAMKSMDMMLRILDSFGCTPASKDRLGITADGEQIDPLSLFLEQNG